MNHIQADNAPAAHQQNSSLRPILTPAGAKFYMYRNTWIAFWNILMKDMRTYYLKPPNLSWGIIFPLAWTLMFFIRSGSMLDIQELLPGVIALSIIFGTTSMLAVTITFERRGRSFERLLLAPISLPALIIAKTAGAIIFGIVNALIPLILAALITNLNLREMSWGYVLAGILLTAIVSAFLGLWVAVSAKEVFEAQTFSNFFRFPMIFLCGLFVPISSLPAFLRPLSFILPPTYGVDLIRLGVTPGGRQTQALLSPYADIAILTAFIVIFLLRSLALIRRRWIT
jgi:ABC-2 type transport system permease protein